MSKPAKPLVLTQAAAVAMFVDLGFSAATSWDTKRINKRLATIASTADTASIKSMSDEDAKATFQKVLEAAKANRPVSVDESSESEEAPEAEAPKSKKGKKEAESETETEEPAPKSKKGKKEAESEAEEPKSKKSSKKTEEKAPKDPAPTDAYGNREGSDAARINAALVGEFKSIKQVAEEAGVTEHRVRHHFRKLTLKGVGEVSPRLIRIKPEGESEPAPAKSKKK